MRVQTLRPDPIAECLDIGVVGWLSGTAEVNSRHAALPTNSSTPSARQRTKRPVPHIQLLGGHDWFPTNRSAVKPVQLKYPRARPTPAI
jgi:hypothetical protein